jgi:preprotein translocase subunit SecA
MAGRGTDIKLGGNFEHRLNRALENRLQLGDPEKLGIDAIRARVRELCQTDEEEVLEPAGSARHRETRGAAHRQPAARAFRTPGQRGRVALLPLAPDDLMDLLPRLGHELHGSSAWRKACRSSRGW